MGFREFLTDRLFRRRLAADLERKRNPQPPKNPSRHYIDNLVGRLLEQSESEYAKAELEVIGANAVPALATALADKRYWLSEWPDSSYKPTPLDSVLSLLVAHAPEEVIKVSPALLKSSSKNTRKAVALSLASIGRVEAIPVLQELLNDEDSYVRSYVAIGMGRAVSDHGAGDEFRRRSYDIMLPQIDQEWKGNLNNAAATLIALDHARAAVDFADERWLNSSNFNLSRILDACNSHDIRLPEPILRKLLDEALPKAEGEDCYPNEYIVAAALIGLAHSVGESIRPLVESLLQHDRDHIQEAAGEAISILAGLTNPVGFTGERENAYGYESLTREQRVVYCAFWFDAEVHNGGLAQFFGNSSGDHAADTLVALRELGHVEAEAALAGAIKAMGPLALETDRERRLMAFEGRYEELQGVFDPLESAYYRSTASLRQSWLLYAARHAEHFRDA